MNKPTISSILTIAGSLASIAGLLAFLSSEAKTYLVVSLLTLAAVGVGAALVLLVQRHDRTPPTKPRKKAKRRKKAKAEAKG